MKEVVVIGGGLGGLAAAITLQYNGFSVSVFEKNEHFGGKLMPIQLNDYYFDFGPNTITMPHVFQHVIEQTGEKADDYFQLIKLASHTRNFFPDGTSFDFSTSQQIMKAQLKMIDTKGLHNYPSFLAEIERLYHLSARYFLPRMFTSWKDYLSPSLGAAFLRVRPLETLDHFFQRYFQHKHILQAFNRYATYIGSSPYQTPATFAMIAYLELIHGVYYVKGGNSNIAKSFVRLARKLGVKLYPSTQVTKLEVKDRKINKIILNSGETVNADFIIMNADLLKAYPHLVLEKERPHFTNQKIEGYEPSISAFVILAGLKKRHQGLLHHNVFFSNNYEQEFRDLFTNKCYSTDPTIYICNSSYTDPTVAPSGDNLFILVNAPSTKNAEAHDGLEDYKELVYKKLETYGISINPHLAVEKVISPLDIEEKFGAFKGALYGISANHRMNAFLRPSNIAKDIHNLYFAGGTTHPGGGSPMVTISGLNVANHIIKTKKETK
ncbi:phytoene desaturase family protein [Bacillus sp. 165]|uniref:phytoene desaturase family protein n=1 Tax=Bacillus sp. 165 TaxID=1529117 RepID=UPI001ADC82B1|nr:phytoene desaturase family protein [Bacillus sp. 165]MBO9128688.1 phytoene desaturase [Bacillus sp. 165]